MSLALKGSLAAVQFCCPAELPLNLNKIEHFSKVSLRCNVSFQKKTARAVYKPNSVPDWGYSASGNDHSSMDTGCPVSPATYPGVWTGHPQTLLYLVLHRVGFTKLSRSPGKLVRSYRTFSPLPGTQFTD